MVFPITDAVRTILWPLRGQHPDFVFTYVAVYGNEEQTAFYSSRMNVKQCSGYPHPTFRVDWLLLCTK